MVLAPWSRLGCGWFEPPRRRRFTGLFHRRRRRRFASGALQGFVLSLLLALLARGVFDRLGAVVPVEFDAFWDAAGRHERKPATVRGDLNQAVSDAANAADDAEFDVVDLVVGGRVRAAVDEADCEVVSRVRSGREVADCRLVAQAIFEPRLNDGRSARLRLEG